MEIIVAIVSCVALGLFVGLMRDSYAQLLLTAALSSGIWLWFYWRVQVQNVVEAMYGPRASLSSRVGTIPILLTVVLVFVGLESAVYWPVRWLTW